MTHIAILKGRIKMGGDNASYGRSAATSMRTYTNVQSEDSVIDVCQTDYQVSPICRPQKGAPVQFQSMIEGSKSYGRTISANVERLCAIFMAFYFFTRRAKRRGKKNSRKPK